ncbi:MAG: SIMPL domain-containing protein [Gallionella sp.]|nr:SIMPL domain-containing protein [Gallionella sp.]MCK9353481.1 SIMPL domain-containing protein [Gallionella sp.]
MLRIALLFSLLSLQNWAHAENEPYNRVDFRVEAAREVANDLLVAGMSIEVQDKQPARVAQQINAALNDALKKAAAFGNVKVSSGGHNSYPVYGKDNRIDGWRGHAEIHLESRDFKAAGELIMQLQSTLQLNGLNFTLAPDSRAQSENDLIAESIKAFQARADTIRAALGARAYKTVHFSINSGMPPQYPKTLMRAAPMAADAAIPQPEFAGGDTRMTVQVSGTIELQ